MKRTILLLAVSFLLCSFYAAGATEATLIAAKHHVQHHHAHKAGKHKAPKRQRRTV